MDATAASTIAGAIIGAFTTSGMFLAWIVRNARREEHRLTTLEEKADDHEKAIDGLLEESRTDANRTQEFANFVRGKLSSHDYQIRGLEERTKRR